MSKQTGKFGRRQVLQLETEVKKNAPSYGFGYNTSDVPLPSNSGALSGLVSQYGPSDEDDSDEDNPDLTAATSSKGPIVPMQAFVAASEPEPLGQVTVPNGGSTNGESKQPKSILRKKDVPKSILKPGKKEDTPPPPQQQQPPVVKETDPPEPLKQPPKEKAEDDVEEKLKDFLAEIDALDHAPVDSEKLTTECEDLDGEPMTPPTLEEIEKPETDSDNEEEVDDPEPVKPKEPTTPWEHCLDEQTQYYYYWNMETNVVTWEIPDGFSQYLLQVKEYETEQNKYEAAKRDWDGRQKNKPPKIKEKKKKVVLQETKTPPPPPPPSDRKDEKLEEIKPVTIFPPEPLDPPPPLENEPKKPTSSKEKKESKKNHKKHKKSKDHDSGSHQDSDILIGPQPAPPPLIGPQMPSKDTPTEDGPNPPIEPVDKGKEDVGKNTDVGNDGDNQNLTEADDIVGTEEMDDDFIHKQLEEPVFTHYEYVNKKIEAPPPPQQPTGSAVKKEENSFDLDMEDIDKELEMALERKKAGDVDNRGSGKPGGTQKRSHSEVESPQTLPHLPKRPKTEPVALQDTSDVISVGRLHKQDLRMKIDALAEASELSNLVIDKLEFLDVQRGGLSDLQILLIELQTRIEDWKKGGLNTEYLLIKLRQADHHLQKYEEHAAPAGWQCQWDRQVNKYYYFHSVSGESQWDYPMEFSGTEVPEDYADLPSEQLTEMAMNEQEETPEMSVEIEATEPQPAKNTFLDFAQLAEAPPPPPGEPPPPGTEPLTVDPAISATDISGYNDSDSEDPSETEDTSSDSETDSMSSSSSSSDSDYSGERHNSSKEYDPSEPSQDEKAEEEVVEEPTLDPAILLPVHSKPVHIAAEPMIKRPMPAVSPSPEKAEAEKAAEVASAEVPEGSVEGSSGDGEQRKKATGPSTDSEVVSGEKLTEVSGENVTPGEGAGESVTKAPVKEKKKKKDKSLSCGGLSMKRKGMSSMVEKWQRVQKDVEKESKAKKSKTEVPVIEEDL